MQASGDITPRAVMRPFVGLSTMSSYRHVADRDDLIVAMVDAITRQTTIPDDPDTTWQEAVRAMALGDWHAFVEHPG